MRFTKPKKVIGLDIGSQSVKAVQVAQSGRGMNIEKIGYAQIDRIMLNADPVATHAKAIREAISDFSIQQSMVVGALPGQSVVIRYPRINDTTTGDLDDAVEREASQSIPYDLSEVLLDWSLLAEEGEGESRQSKVLLVAAKHDVIDQRIQFADIADIEFSTLTVDSLAIADAAEACQLSNNNETVALIDIGSSSVGIHFTKNGVSNFIRDISWGGKELIQAIAKHNRMDYEEAERLLLSEADGLTRNSSDSDDVVEVSPVEEPSMGLDSNDLGLETAMPQSDATSLMGGASEEETLVDILSTPISRLVTEVRRSFDYYEHQLYEHPVDRIILCGGAANLPLIRETLSEELGIEQVTVADPSAGAVSMNKRVNMNRGSVRPTQYMVAVGLAARGLAEL